MLREFASRVCGGVWRDECSDGRGWRRGVLLLLLLVLFLTMPRLGQAQKHEGWLLSDIRRPPFRFTATLYPATRFDVNPALRKYLTENFPHGSDKVIPLPNDLREKVGDGNIFEAVYIKIEHNGKLLYSAEYPTPMGMISNNTLPQKNDFPYAGCTTYTVLLNSGAASSLVFERLMLSSCPDEDFMTEEGLDCYYDLLIGGMEAQSVGTTSILETCDFSLDFYGDHGHWGLPRPTRLLVFDAQSKTWHEDGPGEVPMHYVNQAFRVLREYLPDSLGAYLAENPNLAEALRGKQMPKTEELLPANALTDEGRQEAMRQGRLIMAELLARKSAVVAGDDLDIAFAAYSFIMMGFAEQEVRQFFTTMIDEYIRTNGSFDWSRDTDDPQRVFADIKEACVPYGPMTLNYKALPR